MLRLALGAALLVAANGALAQRVPGRDLLTYPLGLAGEPAALGTGPSNGLWNPATTVLGPDETLRLAGAGVSAPIDLALSAQVVGAAFRIRSLGTLSFGLAHAAVVDLVHTETDPQSVGGDIPYTTWLISAGLARAVSNRVSVGGALRWHTGRVMDRTGNAAILDIGAVAHGLTSLDARVGASTFLASPQSGTRPALAAAADARVYQADSVRTLRAGLGLTVADGGGAERFPFVDARFHGVRVRGGPVQVRAYGVTSWRARLAVLLTHSDYTLSVVREDNASGLAPTYQLGVVTVFR